MSVTDDEYALYAAWVRHTFKEQPSKLLLARSTFRFDPREECKSKEWASNGIPTGMLESLHDPGQAGFPVATDKFQQPLFRIMWRYEESDPIVADSETQYQLVSFSRVSFNGAGDKALFAVGKSCGGLCGGGGALIATRVGDDWRFSSTGCVWVY